MRKKIPLREYRYIIDLPIYNFKINVIFTNNLFDTAVKLEETDKLTFKPEDLPDDCTGAFHVKLPNRPYSFIILKNNGSCSEMVHECYHATCNLFKFIGAEYEEELFAYNLDFIVGEICGFNDKVIRRERAKKVKKVKNPLDKNKNLV